MATIIESADTEPVSAQPRKVPLIDPKTAVVHDAGFAHKTLVVQMPDGLTLTDLNENPTVWKRIQADRSGKALGEWDAVELRGRDMMICARVNHAGADRVTLFGITRHSKPQRDVPLYRDDLYEVRWVAEGGFSYFRCRDNVRMSAYSWPTAESAKMALIENEYPKSSTSGVVG
jgi:hypothetical protein